MVTAEQLGRMRQQYESGSDIAHIAKAFGLQPPGVLYHARTKKWNRPA